MKAEYPTKSKLSMDLTPLIDVMFQVIFFLILSLGKTNYNITLNLPRLNDKGLTLEKEVPIIAIKKEEEQIYWNQEKISLQELELKILNENIENVILKIDKEVVYGKIIKVLSVLQKNEKIILNFEYEMEHH